MWWEVLFCVLLVGVIEFFLHKKKKAEAAEEGEKDPTIQSEIR